jgi:hypothetical protein
MGWSRQLSIKAETKIYVLRYFIKVYSIQAERTEQIVALFLLQMLLKLVRKELIILLGNTYFDIWCDLLVIL